MAEGTAWRRSLATEYTTVAEEMIPHGVAVVVAPPRRGSAEFRFRRWGSATADPHVLARWRTGWMLAAVTGVAFDVIDVDPRNGGDCTLEQLAGRLPAVRCGSRHSWRRASPLRVAEWPQGRESGRHRLPGARRSGLPTRHPEAEIRGPWLRVATRVGLERPAGQRNPRLRRGPRELHLPLASGAAGASRPSASGRRSRAVRKNPRRLDG